jgi:dipeptidyl aminopeptidase/acylaminoacyl peptidase
MRTTAAIALFLAATVTAQTPRPMTAEDVLALKAVNSVKISPDGKLVLYELAYSDLRDNRAHNEIWVAAATDTPGSRKPRKFTSGTDDRSPQWSRDGEWVAFLGTRGTPASNVEPTHPQVYLMPAFGGEAEALTDAKDDVSAFSLSPDATRIAFVATVPLTDAQEREQKDKNDARVVDGDHRFSHLWVVDTVRERAPRS